MMDYQTFPSKKAALTQIATMRGWDAKPVRFTLQTQPDSNETIDAWVIQCDGSKFLRSDGYVR